MPSLKIDMFDSAPKIGDKVQVTGKVQSIDDETGDVEVSYDEASVVGSGSKKDKSTPMKDETMPNSQSLDEALSKSFPNTQ